MPEIQKTWVRFKQFFCTYHQEPRERSNHTVENAGMHHANMVRNVIIGLQEALQQDQVQTETSTVVQAPVYHVANTVQNTYQQLAIHLQKNASDDARYADAICCISTWHMSRLWRPPVLWRRLITRKPIQLPWSRRKRRTNSGDWRGGRSGQANSNLTHYCWTQRMRDHPGKDCRDPSYGHQKDVVWCNKMSGSEINCT